MFEWSFERQDSQLNKWKSLYAERTARVKKQKPKEHGELRTYK